MKLKLFIIMGILSSVLGIFSCENNKSQKNLETDLNKENLKGHVKSVREIGYTLVLENGECIKKGIIPINTLEEVNRELFFLRNGYIDTLKYFNTDNELIHTIINLYNHNNLLLESEVISNDYDIVSDKKYIYSYNNKNNLIQKKDDNTNRIIEEYEYDKKNLLKAYYNDTYYSKEVIFYTYNIKKQIIKEVRRTLYKDSSSVYENTFEYNTEGLISEMKSFVKEGAINALLFHYKYFYNSNDDIIKIIQLGSRGNIERTTIYQYIYDKNNNWINKKINFIFYDKEESYQYALVEREINYY